MMNDRYAPIVGRRDQLCGILKADIAADHAGGRGYAINWPSGEERADVRSEFDI
jgi:hypothetical protein